MTKKETMAFNLPTPIREAFEGLASKYSVKEKWVLCSAAILLLIEAGPGGVDTLFRLVKSHDFDDASIKRLIESATTGTLLDDVKREPAKTFKTSAGSEFKRAAKVWPGGKK